MQTERYEPAHWGGVLQDLSDGVRVSPYVCAMKVHCIENRFSLRMVGPNTSDSIATDIRLPNLVVGKGYGVGGDRTRAR